jgi:hypothetical protein
MKNFRFLDRMVDRFLLFLLVCAILIFFFSCSSKASMYHIYLEHQPSEPLYSTSSLKDAQEYYKQFKPFHSDIYIRTIEQENNLVILK